MSTASRLLVFILCATNNRIDAQVPTIQWDARYGGLNGDYLTTLIETADGGFVLGGYSWSGIGGDKTQANWDNTLTTTDFWLIKTDANGTSQWDKRFGGDNFEVPNFDVKQTTDGGYIIGGTTVSGVSGDKTQPGFGSTDCWIIKLDGLGNYQWDRTFGGTSVDGLAMIQQTGDGGYILGCYSQSGVSGNKTQPNWGMLDYWIIKLDAAGNFIWDRDVGGDRDDYLTSIEQTSDGGYIVGGFSLSGISGSKSQPNWDVTLSTSDYWIVKLDLNGNQQWDKRFGGTFWDAGIDNNIVDVKQTTDGGYIVGSISYSGADGDKSEPSFDLLAVKSDYWIVKTDANGNKLWDKKYGGTYPEDDFGNITQTSDGGYLLAGTSYSFASGDKTENNLSNEQTWVVKTDASGIKEWDKTLLNVSTSDDEIGVAIETSSGCFAIANYTSAGVGGDKTQSSRGDFDYWLVLLCDSLSSSSSFINVPNIFTPNGDGVNDFFVVQVGNVRTYECYIYNRWGAPVFMTSDPSIVWNGNGTGGASCSDGTYFYLIRAEGIDGKIYLKKGFLTLLK